MSSKGGCLQPLVDLFWIMVALGVVGVVVMVCVVVAASR